MKRVLLIDDSPTNRNLVETLLQAAGYTVIQAENGLEGLKAFEQETFDLIITDIVMPVMEGLETIQAIRRVNGKIPILAMSGSVPAERRVDYLELAQTLGANRVLQKPFTAATFYQQLDLLFGSAL